MSGRRVAIKELNKKGMNEEELEYQMVELGILKSCFSKNVVEIIDVFEDPSVLHIVQEYIEGVDLCTFLKTTQRTEKLVKIIMKGILNGVEYLHSIGIVHRDIKLENIMIAKTPEGLPLPKLIDFGLSTILIKGQTSRDRYGTLIYSSPEIILGSFHYFPTDIWSLGVLLHMLLVGLFPFLTNDKNLTKRNIVYGKVNFNFPGWFKVTNAAKDLLVRMLEKRQLARITVEQIRNHPWLL
jgi:calcium/calmodulin-dependent protein kinase I